MTVLSFPGQNQVNLAIASGRAAVGLADSPVVAYQIKQNKGEFTLVGKTYEFAPYGLAVPKNSGLAQPMLEALKQLMSTRQVQGNPRKVGHPGRRDQRPEDQRRNEIGAERCPLSGTPVSRDGPRTSGPSPCDGRAGGSPRRSSWSCSSRSSIRSRATRASNGSVVGEYLFDERILEGLRDNPRADRHLDGDRDRPRRPARGDAALPEPARRRGELALHLVLPRHPRAGPDHLLVLHLGPLSENRHRDPVRSRVHPRRTRTR